MKTYFIKGRIRDSAEDGLDSGSDREVASQKVVQPTGARPKGGFKQVRSLLLRKPRADAEEGAILRQPFILSRR